MVFTSLLAQGSRQKADALTKDFWLEPQTIISHALWDTCRRTFPSMCIKSSYCFELHKGTETTLKSGHQAQTEELE